MGEMLGDTVVLGHRGTAFLGLSQEGRNTFLEEGMRERDRTERRQNREREKTKQRENRERDRDPLPSPL